MIKVLIVDDSVARQEQALGRSLLARLKGLGNVDILNGYTYSKGAVVDSGYDILAFHRTFLIDNGWLADVVAEAVASAKWLVLFGGTISENMFFAEGMVLRMSSTDFYSENVVSFFESLSDIPPEGADNLLLKLLYGRKWHAVADLRERYHPGQTLDCILKEYDRGTGQLWVSVKETTANPFFGAVKRHPVGSRRQAVISGKYAGGVFCTLPDETVCLCLYSTRHSDSDFHVGDTVILAIKKFDYDRSLIYGRILSKW